MLVNFLWPANTRSTTTAQKVSVKGFFSKCKKIRKDKEILNEILHYLCSEYIVTAGMSYTWIDRGFFLIVTVWTETVLETDGLAEAAREIFISSKITFQNCISNINMQRSNFLKEYVLKIVVYIYSGFCYWVRAFVISKYNYRAMGVLTLCNMSHGPIVPFLWFFKVLNNVSDLLLPDWKMLSPPSPDIPENSERMPWHSVWGHIWYFEEGVPYISLFFIFSNLLAYQNFEAEMKVIIKAYLLLFWSYIFIFVRNGV